MRILRILIIAAILLAIAVVAAGQAGLLRGTPPTDLGVRDGRLKAPSDTRNSVSSQAALWTGHAQAAGAAIAPLALQGGDGPATLAALRRAIEATPGGRVVDTRADYIRAEFRTRWLGFVDDAEFWLDPAGGVIHVRSASRIGREDLDVNRQRIEALRSRLAGG